MWANRCAFSLKSELKLRVGKCGEVGLLFRGFPILPHTRFTHRGIHVGNPLRCLCGISPSIYHIVFVPTRCVACVHESSCPLAGEVVYNNIVVLFSLSPSARLPHCMGEGAGPMHLQFSVFSSHTLLRILGRFLCTGNHGNGRPDPCSTRSNPGLRSISGFKSCAFIRGHP